MTRRTLDSDNDPLVEAIAAAFALHDPEEWGPGPLASFIEERLPASPAPLIDRERLLFALEHPVDGPAYFSDPWQARHAADAIAATYDLPWPPKP